jgi:hypothetical protein
MGLKRFICRLPDRGLKESAHTLHEWVARKTLTDGFSDETVYDREWDVLVILDACRVDLFAEIADEYEWLPTAKYINQTAIDSVAGSSKEWMERTFGRTDPAELEATAYITGNPFSSQVLDAADFGLLDEVWRYAWDDDVGSIRPCPLVDRAVQAGRDGDYDRIIVHMMQPHAPFLGNDEIHAGFRPDDWGSPEAVRDPDQQGLDVWHRIRRGNLERDSVWNAYQRNLQIALESVEKLRQNMDGQLVLTADHGNALGEHGVWGHPDVPVKGIREVPWVAVDATDTGEYEPKVEPTTDQSEISIEDRLTALGYK